MVRWLWAFQEWATARLMDTAACVDEAALRAPGAIAGGQDDGSIYATIGHCVGAEEHWLGRWLGDPRAPLASGEDYRDLRHLIDSWWQTNERRRQWLASLDDRALATGLRWYRQSGEENVYPIWQTVLHVANHSTHHRAEACAALTAAGCPPQGVDMIDWVRAGCPGA